MSGIRHPNYTGYGDPTHAGRREDCTICAQTFPSSTPPAGWEPGSVDLSHMARLVVAYVDDRDLATVAGHAVLGAWAELLLAPSDDVALDYARRLAADSTRRVTAHVPPL